jgi:4-hydroxy-2-oxovalerate aldolase
MVQLLDTTLRDGSYVVDFQLTAHDTALIAAGLDALNVPFIEVGHGVGMRAGQDPRMRAACPDEEYLRAAAGAVHNGRWGMFFIPGIGRLDDIDMAADHGMHFIRIGTNVTEAAQADPYIARAKARGMFVSSNFMKTYAATPDEVGHLARHAAEAGSDIVCVVDSAGGMFPDDVERYFEGIRLHTDVDVGFHGHNNLGLAIANTLRAVELGAAIVDTSIRGMGRSAGNASTEILLLALRRRGIDLGIDPLRIMTIAEQRIDPMLRNYAQVESIGIISGFAQFHSSFLGTVLAEAERFGVDPRELILRVTEEDKVNAPAEMVERLARELAGQPKQARRVTVPLPQVVRGRGALETDARDVATEAVVLARKLGLRPVFNLVQAYRPGATSRVSGAVVTGSEYVIASAEVASVADARAVATAVDGLADFILLDCDAKSPASPTLVDAAVDAVRSSQLLPYSDLDAWARSIASMVTARLGPRAARHSAAVVGADTLAVRCSQALQLLGFRLHGPADLNERASVAIVCDSAGARPLDDLIDDGGFIVDALIGAIPAAVAEACRARGVAVLRPDMRAVIHAEVAAAAGMARLVREGQGVGMIGEIPVAAGGTIPARGTVVVDSVRLPTKVFGVADGAGLLLPVEELPDELRDRLQAVQDAVLSSIG